MRWIIDLLLRAYPRSFRDRVGDSMTQAVHDSLLGSSGMEKLNIAGNLFAGAAIENGKAIYTRVMSEPIFNRTRLYLLGFLLIVPGIVTISLLVSGINPPLGPLEPYFNSANPMGKWYALAIVLGTVLLLPAIGVWITPSGRPKPNLKAFVYSAGAAILLVLPLVALQAVYGRLNYSSFPTGVFAILWLLPTFAIYLASPLVSRLRSTERSKFDPLSFALRIAALLPIAVMWIALVEDQMPCFLGVPNCD